MTPPWTHCRDCGRKVSNQNVCRCPECLRNYIAIYNDPENKERRRQCFEALANELKPNHQSKEKK